MGNIVTENSTVADGGNLEAEPDHLALAGLVDDGLRQRAAREHRKRAIRQVRSAASIIFLVAAAPPLRNLLYQIASGEVPAWLSDMLSGAKLPTEIGYLNHSFLLIWLVYLIYLQWYMRERGKEWKEHVQQANSSDPEECARGYMAVFRMYARTKRRATFTLAWGVSAVYVGGRGIMHAISNDMSWMILSAAVETALGVAVILVGVSISQRFLPGKVLIGHTLKLSIRAAASNTGLVEAQEQAENIERELKQNRPWWYY